MMDTQVLSYRYVLRQILQLMTKPPVKFHTIRILLVLSQLYNHLFKTVGKIAWDAHTYPSLITLQGKKVAFLPQIQRNQLILLGNFF